MFTLCAYLFTQAHAEDHAAITQFDENGAIFFLEPVQNASSGVWYGRYENVTAVFFLSIPRSCTARNPQYSQLAQTNDLS
ncbi:MAG: hypothetical protein H6656_04960 [Ardenticatenaceae bacterium]|nr:hypothetical protein [Ardenticatenaceae bacterium]